MLRWLAIGIICKVLRKNILENVLVSFLYFACKQNQIQIITNQSKSVTFKQLCRVPNIENCNTKHKTQMTVSSLL